MPQKKFNHLREVPRERKEKIYIIDITEEVNQVVHQLAEEATANYINSLRENRGRNFVSRFIGGIVNTCRAGLAELSRSYLYHHFRRQIENEVRNNYNIFQRIALEGRQVNIDLEDRKRMSEFLRLAIERFESNIADRFSRDVEIGRRIENEKDLQPLKNLIAEMVREFVRQENIDTPEGRIRFNQEFSNRLRDLIQRGEIQPELFYGPSDQRIASTPEMFSTNIYDYILLVREKIKQLSIDNNLTPEQEKQLNDFIERLMNIDIQLGRLASSIRTKLPDAGKKGTSDYTLSRIEELCLRLENIPILNKIINPVTVGLASSIISREGLIRIGGRGLAAAAAGTVLGSIGYLAGPILIGSVLAGYFAYQRGKARFKQDVGRILREQAAGLEINDFRARQVLERIALSGGQEFRRNIHELIQGIRNNDENSYKEAVARLELEFETRTLESDMPQLDLLISSGEWRSSFIEKYELEKAILEFERNLSTDQKEKLKEEIESIKTNLRQRILEQDERIKKEARRVGIRNGVITGAVAFALGSSIQYLRDLLGETQLGEELAKSPLGQIISAPRAKERITLIEYLLGERPRAGKEGFTTIFAGGHEIIIPDHEKTGLIEKVINLPDGNYGIARFNPEQHQWVLDLSSEAKNAGWVITDNGFELNKPGLNTTIIEGWGQIKERLGLHTEKVGWVDFAWEKKPPEVISWQVPPDHPGFHAEGLELAMSWKKAPDGDIYIKVPTMGTAFREGGPSWNIEGFVKNGKAMIVISPRDRILQHDGWILPVKLEDVKGPYAEIKIPKELGEILFTEDGGKLRPNGVQITYNLEVGISSDGKHNLVEIAADYSHSAKPIYIPPIHEQLPVSIKETPPIPPAELDPPIAIPPLIDWLTPQPGIYKMPSSEILPAKYSYYTHGYWQAVEWVRKYSKDIPADLSERLERNIQELNSINQRLRVSKEEEKSQILQRRQEILNESVMLKKQIEKVLLDRYFKDLDRDIESLISNETLESLFELNGFRGKSYKGFIEYLSSQIPPMNNRTRVAVFIPAYHEGKNIRHTLQEYIQQKDLNNNPLDPDVYEIVILDNKREDENWDNTEEEIKRFKEQHPNINIHYIKVQFPQEIAGVGFARRIATDVILYRASKRDNPAGPLYLISEDADLEKVDPQVVIKTLKRFERYPNIDILRGVQVRNPEILAKHDLLLFERIKDNVLELLFRSHQGMDKEWYKPDVSEFPDPFSWSRIISGGWNTAFSATALARIGGYDPRLKVGEDLFIGNAVSIVRAKEIDSEARPVPNLETIKTVASRSSSSMRRYLLQLFKDIYGKFGDPELERTIRTKTEEEILSDPRMEELKVINLENIKSFEESINWSVEFLFRLTRNPQEGRRRANIFLRLFLLREGYDYNWQNGKVFLVKDSAVKRLKLNFELFRLYVERYGYEAMVRTKRGIWPVWSGFKVPTFSERGTFQLIQEIGKNLEPKIEYEPEKMDIKDIVSQENKIIDMFLSLPQNKKLEIVEKLIKIAR